MADSNAPVTFAIPGQRAEATRGAAVSRPLPGGLRAGEVDSSVRVGASRDAGLVRVQAVPGIHVVAISIDGGPDLILHPHVARELLQAQVQPPSRAANAVRPHEVLIPPTLRWPSPEPAATSTRGRLGDFVGGIVVKAVDVLKDVVQGAARDAAADVATTLVAKAVDAQVTEGVYRLRPAALDLKGAQPVERVLASDRPMLVFIHGTFSSTTGGFGRLWSESPGRVATLFGKGAYGDDVYALDHATLGASPIKNALSLAKALPRGARLHLATHSRGGLIAELLAQLCVRSSLTPAELAPFVPEQRDELMDLAREVKNRELRVERIVRVACPIRGTLLASKRLDAYLSVLKWSMNLAGWGVAGEVVDFLAAVAKHRLDPESLPGLAAQVPHSPLVQWLHADPQPIPGELRVVAGDIEGDSVLTWIKTLMSDGFYWTDNDVVVQTRSMYGGARRRSGATFVLDQGGKVLHTRYFAKDRVAEAIFRAIVDDDPRDFRRVGPLSWAGDDSSGDRAAQPGPPADAAAPEKRPAVLLIPGFGASRLTGPDGLVWPAAMATRTLDQLRYTGAAPLRTDGFVGSAFDAVHAALASTHHVIRFPYDWRAPLEVEAQRLAEAIQSAFNARVNTRQPVRLLTHSSGALLARVLQLEHPEVWERLMAHPEGRVVMLAPPNDGMWTPMQVLSGDETFGGLLTAGAPPFSEPQVRDAFGTMPGMLQLQAGIFEDRYKLDQLTTWTQLAAADAAYEHAVRSWHNANEQHEQHRWGRLSADALQSAVTLRRRLDAAARALTPEHAAKMAIVAAAGTATPDGLPDENLPNRPQPANAVFVYVDTPRGDGRVTVDRTRLPGVPTFMVDSDHGSLPSLRDAIPGYIDLLTKGTTKQLRPFREAPLGDDVRTRSRMSRRVPPPMPENEGDILSARPASPRATGQVRRAIRIRVVHGDLMFVREPLIIGHYRSMRLTGTERVMDRLIGRSMSRSLAIDMYPDRPTTFQIFINTHVQGDDRIRVPRPEAVVVVGLGEEGTLTTADLVLTVRKGVVAWAQRMAERREAPPIFDLAATLIGSGGKGMDVSAVAPLLAEAVGDADTSLETAGLPRVGELKIIELFLDRAADAWHALTLQASQAPDRYQVAATIAPGAGALRRPPGTHYRGADYDFVSIAIHDTPQGSELAYSLDTRRARTDVVRQVTQMSLLLQLLDSSNVQPAAEDVGRTLFNTLIPVELEPLLGSSTDIVLELDNRAAGLPWELLDTTSGARGQDAVPWAIRSKIVRKLRMDTPEAARRDATADDFVLVIGEPRCDPDRYLRLAGARREATAVAECLEKDGGPQVVKVIAPDDEDLLGPDSVHVLSALHQHPYRIIHVAGHGEPTVTGTRVGGVVLSPFGPDKQETYLGAGEIRGIRTVPELVFINCCHVGARERLQLVEPDSPLLHRYDRPRFAAGLAEALIGIGVRCVIAAGWAVDDRAAETFAVTFYGSMLAGKRFIDATADARTAAAAHGGTTWAAFQCWGDPEWRYLRQTSDAQRDEPDPDWPRQHAEIASPHALVIVLETIATRAKFDPQDEDSDAQRVDSRARIADLERRFGDMWGGIGRVGDAFGTAYAETNDLAMAAAWYQRAIEANDGTAPLRAAEQLSNMRIRIAWKQVESLDSGPALSPQDRSRLAAAAATIDKEIESVRVFMRLRPTMELGSLLGSAYKRLAMVSARAGDTKAERDACANMQQAYADAETYGGKDNLDVFYPVWHRLVSDAIVLAGTSTGNGLKPEDVSLYRSLLERKEEMDEDFWSAAGHFELSMIQAVAAGALASVMHALMQDFRQLAERVPSPRMWASVHDNATFVLDIYRRRLRERAARTQTPRVDDELFAIDAVLAALGEIAGKGRTAPIVPAESTADAPQASAAEPRPTKTNTTKRRRLRAPGGGKR